MGTHLKERPEMLHVLTDKDPLCGERVLAAMFEARKRVFVDLLGWRVPVIAGRYEVDQFDDAHATYLILTDPDGAHRASARLLPTSRPHILDSLYPDLCDEDLPRGPDVMEVTRFCLDRRLPARERRVARDQLVSAIADHGLATNVTLFTGVAEMGWLQQILAFGWRCRPLGLPRRHDGALLGALAITIDRATPTLLAAAGTYVARTEELRDAA
jgi:N-acyl-L-homoserine lactone synthetase